MIGNVQNFAIVRKASSTHCFFFGGEFSPLFRKKGPTTSTKSVFEKILHNLSNFKKTIANIFTIGFQYATRGIKGFLKKLNY